MKLTDVVIQQIKKATDIAKITKLENIIIDTDTIRGMDDMRQVILLHHHSDDLPFESLALTRIPSFITRMGIIQQDENFEVQASIHNNNVTDLKMSGMGTNISFRCADAAQQNVPKQITDEMQFRIPFTDDMIDAVKNAVASMKMDAITIIGKDDVVSIEMIDVNNDIFNFSFTSNIENLLDDEPPRFTKRYQVKNLLPLLSNCEIGYFEIGKKGALIINVFDLNVYLVPMV